MSTSERKYHIFPQKSLVITNLHFASVTNFSKTRIVHETGMHDTEAQAKFAARQWAETSQSKKAKSLSRPGR